MRTVAWLNATLEVPRPASTRNRSTPAHDSPRNTCRRQQLEAAGTTHTMPDAGPAAYLLDVLFDVGPVVGGGMAAAPLGYEHLHAWQCALGQQLMPWELRVLRQLSCAYCAELASASDPQEAAPGSADEAPQQEQDRRERVAKSWRDGLRAMAGKAD